MTYLKHWTYNIVLKGFYMFTCYFGNNMHTKQVTGIQKPDHLYFIEITNKITVITQQNLHMSERMLIIQYIQKVTMHSSYTNATKCNTDVQSLLEMVSMTIQAYLHSFLFMRVCMFQ